MKRIAIGIWLMAVAALGAQGFTPDEAVKRMKLAKGFSVVPVATEPLIRQPLSMSFDTQGRLWVLQYLQYPNPAGLKAVKQDQYLRTVWDKVPEPPPKGPKGIDRITIMYDPDERGVFRKSKDFLDNLNLATGFCLGRGGVYVLQSPYLLFYADKNGDDKPDGDPEVLLTGFGMEDTHSYANSLQWGPDGWLYGAHGSTVTAKIKNPANPKAEPIEFQQGIWRYHPGTKQFELFSEGGGNTYGLDFDQYGRCIAGTNYGGYAMLHQHQGAYYVKGFSKHGPLHNPYTYGYFEHVPYKNFKGGHVTCGGVLYEADGYPKEYHHQYIAGNLLSNAVYWHKLSPNGSTYTAEHGGDLIEANDTWFRPVDCLLGPDGCIYVADWYDKRAAHLDPVDNWDKTNGRIYRLDYEGMKRPGSFDLDKLHWKELVKLLKHPNRWWRNEARRLLVEKFDTEEVFQELNKQFQASSDREALELFWVFSQLKGFSAQVAVEIFESNRDATIRMWALRTIVDRFGEIPEQKFNQLLIRLEESAKNPLVATQMVCSAKRLPWEQGRQLIDIALRSSLLDTDPCLKLLTWWAIEHHLTQANATATVTEVSPVSKIVNQLVWPTNASQRKFMYECVAKRLIAIDIDNSSLAKEARFVECVRLLDSKELAPHDDFLRLFEQQLTGLTWGKANAATVKWLQELGKQFPGDNRLLVIQARLGDAPAKERMTKLAMVATNEAERLRWITTLGQIRSAQGLEYLQKTFVGNGSEAVRMAAMNAALAYQAESTEKLIMEQLPKAMGNWRAQVLRAILSKPTMTIALLAQVEAKEIDPKTIPIELMRATLDFKDEKIDQLVTKHWGKIGPATPGEKQARITWLNIQLNQGKGDVAKGKLLFTKHCATCHQLFGEGAKVGPDLTTADRKNRGYMLTHIVDPSVYVRPEFMTQNVLTLDSRRLSGVVSETNDTQIVLTNVIDSKVIKTTIGKKEIEDIRPSAISLMPEKILDPLSYDEIRDLFAYLQSDGPKK